MFLRSAGSSASHTRRAAKIAMIGSRGMPANYGGVETVVDVAARELARRGHEVTVFCRKGDYEERPASIDGVRLVYLWAPATAGLAALIHSALASLWVLPRRFDVIHYHALGPGLMAFLPRILTRSRIVQTVHGRDDKRAKWGRIPRLILGLGAKSSARVPHETLVVSRELAAEYRDEFGRATRVVPNATGPVERSAPAEALAERDLTPGDYVISIGRIVPEKAPHELVEAFVDSDLDTKLVMIGGSAGTDEYADSIKASTGGDPRVVFTGAVYGDALGQLLAGAAVFITASHLEGLPTALIEAGRTQTPCLASDLGPHLEILGSEGPGRRTFPVGNGEEMVDALGQMLAQIDLENEGAALLAADLDERFSIERAGDVHEYAYRLVTEPDVDLVERPLVPELAGDGADRLLDASH